MFRACLRELLCPGTWLEALALALGLGFVAALAYFGQPHEPVGSLPSFLHEAVRL